MHHCQRSACHHTCQHVSTSSTTGHPVIGVGAVLYIARMAAFLETAALVQLWSKSSWKSPRLEIGNMPLQNHDFANRDSCFSVYGKLVLPV